jgi:hypothetical protein
VFERPVLIIDMTLQMSIFTPYGGTVRVRSFCRQNQVGTRRTIARTLSKVPYE